MTAKNQDFTVNAGDDYSIIIQTFNGNGSGLDLNGKTITWIVKTPSVITKTGIKAVGNTITIPLLSKDTLNMKGKYEHSCKVVDGTGKQSTITKGFVTIE